MSYTSQGIVVKDYLRSYPNAPSATIARILLHEHPEAFANLDHARRIVRYYRGASGDRDRERMSPDSYVPMFSIPESSSKEYKVFEIEKESFPLVLTADWHIPYHDQDGIEVMLEKAAKDGVKTLVLVGDIIDLYMMSVFEVDPRMRNIAEEFDMMVEILDSIHTNLPDLKIIYKLGNHEERFDRYIMNRAPELFHIDTMRFEAFLKTRCPYLEVVGDKRVIHAIGLNIIHGHEYKASFVSPVNPARGLFLRAKKTSICFHHHQTSEHTEPTIEGKHITTWSGGCMCGLNPMYMPLNKWNLGFASVQLHEDLMFTVYNHRIINYRVM